MAGEEALRQGEYGRGTHQDVYKRQVCAYLAEKSIHGQSGARDLRNNIRRMVEDKLAMVLVERGEGAISGVALSVQDGELRQEVL